MTGFLEEALESEPVPLVETSYAVPGWGRGALWMREGVLLAHDFHFHGAASSGRTGGAGRTAQAGHAGDVARARPPVGARRPPTGTVPPSSSRMGNAPVEEASLQPTANVPDADELVTRFRALLAGHDVGFEDVEIDLEWATSFQAAVAAALRDVGRGEVVTYGELAAIAGFPGAARAVGSFCAANRFALVVPCHRVVSAHGIGGYGSSGVEVKRRLLALEGVVA